MGQQSYLETEKMKIENLLHLIFITAVFTLSFITGWRYGANFTRHECQIEKLEWELNAPEARDFE